MINSKDFDFSLLMSVYKGDNPIYFKEATNSITSQTLLPNEVILVQDGPVDEALNRAIYNFVDNGIINVKLIKLEKNLGLGAALAEGMKYVSCDYIARMDSDDISNPFRFEVQMDYLKENPDISVLGSYITEFDSKTQKRRLRKVPTNHKLVKKYIRFRSPLNHVTVIFKKKDVLEVGGYESVLRYEDFYLWFKMTSLGLKITNIPLSLVDVRAGEDLIKRLNGIEAFKKDLFFFRKLYTEGFITYYVLFINLLMRLITRFMPIRVTSFIYYLIRKI
jgi:glycosyltransferase involved in cell wall biosynthesis